MLFDLSLLVLVGTAATVSAGPHVWTVSVHNDANCEDPALFGFSGFDDSTGFFLPECLKIKAPASAKALWFQDSEAARHVLSVYDDETCSAMDSRDLNPSVNTNGFCVPINNGAGFSLERRHVPPQAQSRGLSVRQPDEGFFKLFWARSARVIVTVGSAMALCVPWGPACAAVTGAVTAVITIAMTTWELSAYHQRQAGGSPVRLLDSGDFDYDPSQDIFSIDGPESIVKSIEPGMSTKFTRSSAVVGRSLFGRDNLDETHQYFEVENTNEFTGEVTHSFLDFEPEVGHGVVSSKAGAAPGLDKRQNQEDYTAHYSFDNMQEHAQQHFPIPSGEIERLAETLWNVKHENDIGNPCVSFGEGDTRFNRGYFQMSTGAFDDQLRDCPMPN